MKDLYHLLFQYFPDLHLRILLLIDNFLEKKKPNRPHFPPESFRSAWIFPTHTYPQGSLNISRIKGKLKNFIEEQITEEKGTSFAYPIKELIWIVNKPE